MAEQGDYMSRKRKKLERLTLLSAYQSFVMAKRASGLAEKTLETYIFHFNAFARYIDMDTPLDELDKLDLEKAIGELAKKGLSSNTIRSYTASLKTFLSWCRENELADIDIPLYKGEETVKETYTDEELRKLLVKPNLKKTSFTTYKLWVIENLLVSNGIRAATVRAIRIRDVSMDQSLIRVRHNKSRKALIIPLSPEMASIIAGYMKLRKGNPDDPLFPDVYGDPMSENCLRMGIKHYNHAHGVQKTGIHMFRHTFARLYLIDCKGDALKLQKLLGHSTLKMTQHYVQIYNDDLIRDYQTMSPLDVIKKKKKGQF